MPEKKLRGLPASVTRQLPDVQNCDTPLLQALWALRVAKISASHPEFIKADDISHMLLRGNVHLPVVHVQRALARAGRKVAKRGKGEVTEFRIMGLGEEFLEDRAGGQGPLTLYVTGQAPWSDRRFVVKESMKKLSGNVRILDKYFGMESLDFLLGFQKTRRIRFLTAHPSRGHDLNHLQREVALFKREFPNAEFKAYLSPHELHDRYVLFDKEVWFVGHGIKDIGRKESFVVILQDPFGKDIRNTLLESFETRWAASPDF
ncbi:MAG TPA: hypothetical protein VGT03_15490 [Candidatus Acidoferrales bacterium]|nr:hypothetical protein [Candidatus Acidoferrales bacterium]